MIEICKDKQATRPLYEEAFDDSPEFVDYYYNDKCTDNTIFVSREDGKIVAMLHLNPFTMSICGKISKVYYVVAVATTESKRHQGHMSRLFETALEHMRLEEIPFCFLLPVDESIYSWLGFETITDFRRKRIMNYSDIRSSFDIYCIQDENYIHRMGKELALNALDKGEVLPDSPVIMAKVTNLAKLSAIADIPFADEKQALAWLRSRRIYICEEV